MHAFTPLNSNNLLTAGNTLTQRTFRTSINDVIVKMDIRGMADGQKAGISHFGSPDYSTIGVSCIGNKKFLEYGLKEKTIQGPVINKDILWLKSTWGLDGKSHYYYSIDGELFIPFGETYQMLWESYRGDRVAIFNYNNKSSSGYVDVDYFHYSMQK